MCLKWDLFNYVPWKPGIFIVRGCQRWRGWRGRTIWGLTCCSFGLFWQILCKITDLMLLLVGIAAKLGTYRPWTSRVVLKHKKSSKSYFTIIRILPPVWNCAGRWRIEMETWWKSLSEVESLSELKIVSSTPPSIAPQGPTQYLVVVYLNSDCIYGRGRPSSMVTCLCTELEYCTLAV